MMQSENATDVQIAAARLRVSLDTKRGRHTPERIRRLAAQTFAGNALSREENPTRRRLCLGVDVVDFARTGASQQSRLRHEFQQALAEAALRAGLRPSEWDSEDRGDGILALLPGMPEPSVIEDFVRHLEDVLDRVQSLGGPVDRLRLRVAMHGDVVSAESDGLFGPAVATIIRLLDAEQLRAAMRAASAVNLAVVMSDDLYKTFRRGHTMLRLRHIMVTVKEFAAPAWIYVPGEENVPPLSPSASKGESESEAASPEPGANP